MLTKSTTRLTASNKPMKKYKLSFKQALKALVKGKIIECETAPTVDHVIKCQMRLTDKGIEAKYLFDFRHLPIGAVEWSDWEDCTTWEWDEDDYKTKYRIVK